MSFDFFHFVLIGIACGQENARRPGRQWDFSIAVPKPHSVRGLSVTPWFPALAFVRFTHVRDRLTPERRSWNMSRIRGKNTSPELIVRRLLHRMGYRFRLHVKTLPGKPDIVLPKYKTVIFVHGCFWHRHKGCKNCTTPTNRREFWLEKLNGNALRDKVHQRALRKIGWKSITVWECQISDSGGFGKKSLKCPTVENYLRRRVILR